MYIFDNHEPYSNIFSQYVAYWEKVILYGS